MHYIYKYMYRLLTVPSNYLTTSPPKEPQDIAPSGRTNRLILSRYSFLWHALPDSEWDLELQKSERRVAWCHLGTAQCYTYQSWNFGARWRCFFFFEKNGGGLEDLEVEGLGPG